MAARRTAAERRTDRRGRAVVADDVPPGMMWPEAGSGFEASPYSPAGRAQVSWRLLRGLPRWARITFAALTLAFFAFMLLAPLVQVVLH